MKLVHRGQVRNGNLPDAKSLIGLGPRLNVGFAQPGRGVSKVPITTGTLLIDTGAQQTCITSRIAKELGYAPIRKTPLVGVSGKADWVDVYRAAILLQAAPPGRDDKGVVMVFEQDLLEIPELRKVAPGLPGADGLLGRPYLPTWVRHQRGEKFVTHKEGA